MFEQKEQESGVTVTRMETCRLRSSLILPEICIMELQKWESGMMIVKLSTRQGKRTAVGKL